MRGRSEGVARKLSCGGHFRQRGYEDRRDKTSWKRNRGAGSVGQEGRTNQAYLIRLQRYLRKD